MLLQRFLKLQSINVRCKALTVESIESLHSLPLLCQLEVTVDNLHNKADKVVESGFTLTNLQKLRLDVGPHKDVNLAPYEWTKLSELQGLTFGSCYRATPEQYEFICCLTTLQTMHLIYNCPTADTLSCLRRLTGLNVHLSEQHKERFLDSLRPLTGLRSLKFDGQPCARSVNRLTAFSNLTSLGFWPDPCRFGYVSKCAIHCASRLCQLKQLQQLRCVFVDQERFVSAQLAHLQSTYRKPMEVRGSPIIICYRKPLWKFRDLRSSFVSWWKGS